MMLCRLRGTHQHVEIMILVLIVAPGHRLARKKAVSFRELAEEPIIMKETGSGTRKLINELFAQNNCMPNVLMETSNAEFIKQSGFMEELQKSTDREKILKLFPVYIIEDEDINIKGGLWACRNIS